MWCAIAQCYETSERFDDAVKCYERALRHVDKYVAT
jgi:hypothetical protein